MVGNENMIISSEDQEGAYLRLCFRLGKELMASTFIWLADPINTMKFEIRIGAHTLPTFKR